MSFCFVKCRFLLYIDFFFRKVLLLLLSFLCSTLRKVFLLNMASHALSICLVLNLAVNV